MTGNAPLEQNLAVSGRQYNGFVDWEAIAIDATTPVTNVKDVAVNRIVILIPEEGVVWKVNGTPSNSSPGDPRAFHPMAVQVYLPAGQTIGLLNIAGLGTARVAVGYINVY